MFLSELLWRGRDFGVAIFDELERWRGDIGASPSAFARHVGVTGVGYGNWRRTGRLPPATPAEVLWTVIAALVDHRREVAIRVLGEPVRELGENGAVFTCPACGKESLPCDFARRTWSCSTQHCPLSERTFPSLAQAKRKDYPGDLLLLADEVSAYLRADPPEGAEADG